MRLEAQQKEELLEMFDQARTIGMTQERLATLLGLERHRLSRWRDQKIKGTLEDGLPGPRQAPHRLLPEEYNGPQNLDSEISYTWEIKGGGPSGTNAKEVSAFI